MIGDAVARNDTTEFRFDIGKAAMVGVVVMVAVSGYTTGKGLLDIVGWSQFYIVLMAAAVVQGMLAIAAWFLGQELARYVLRSRLRTGIEPPSAPLTAVTGIVFTATFLASFFFAFSFWFNELRNLSQRTEDARTVPNSFQIAVMSSLRPAVGKSRENELKEPEKDSLIGPWLTGLTRIEQATQTAREQIEQQIVELRKKDQKAADELRASIARREASIKDARTKLDVATRQKNEAQSEIEKIKQRLAPFEKELEPLRAQYEEHETERLKQCAGIEKRKEGCGPKADIAKRARDGVKRRIDTIEASTKADRARLDVLEKQVREANATIDTQNNVLANLRGSREEQAAGSSADGVPRLEDLTRALAELANRRREFLAQGTPQAYQSVVNACMAILRPLKEAKVAADQLAQQSCESSGVLQLTQTRPARESARAEFEKACSAVAMTDAAGRAVELIPHGQQRVPPEVLGKSFDQINAAIQSCINIAATTGADVAAAEEIRATFARRNAPDRDRFQEALAGLFSGGAHRNAAAGIAAIFDLMILALSFFADLFKIRGHVDHQGQLIRHPHLDTSENPEDPTPLAGAKALRRNTRFDVSTRQLIFDPDAPAVQDLDSDDLDNVFHRLDHFLQQRHANQLKDGRYVLSEEALSSLETYIEQQRVGGGANPETPAQGSGPQDVAPSTPSAASRPFEGAGARDRRTEAPAGQPGRPSQPHHAGVPARSGRRAASDLGSAQWQRPQRHRPAQPSAPAVLSSAATPLAPSVQHAQEGAAEFGIAGLMRRNGDASS
jgi:hypothetical protein